MRASTVAATAAVVLAAAAVTALPQVQKVNAAPGSSVRVDCSSSASGGSTSGGNASSGGGWNVIDALTDLLLGDDDDYDDEDVDDSSDERRTGSEEDDYYWLDLGLYDDNSSEEATRREPEVPDEVANKSLPRATRAAPNWSYGDIDVQAGKNWSVRVFNWVLVRRDPAANRVEVKLLMPNLFSPGISSGGDDEDVDDSGGAREAREASEGAGPIDVQGGENWSVRFFNWVLARRNPATGQVEVKLQIPGLYPPAGDDDDDVDDIDMSSREREARPAS